METENTVIRSSCPHCSTVLKFRNASFAERPFRCTNCDKPLRLVQGLENFFHVVIDDRSPAIHDDFRPSIDSINQKTPSSYARSERKSQQFEKLVNRLKSPAGIAWSVALGGLAVLLFFTLPESKEKVTSPPKKETNTVATDETPSIESSKTNAKNNLPAFQPPLIAPRPSFKFPQVVAKPNPEQKLVTSKNNNSVPLPPLKAPRPRPRQPEIVFPGQQYSPEDFQKAFAQKIQRFEQLKPVSAKLLLEELEEMAGIPLTFDPPQITDAGGILDRKLQLSLTKTNIGEILEKILERLQLEMKTNEKGILIRKKSDR